MKVPTASHADTVCRVAEVVRPAAGGIRRHVSDLLTHLDRQRFTPTLFAPKDFEPDRLIPNLARHSVAIGAATRPLPDYRAASHLAQLLRQNTDIVHAHGLRGAVVGGFAARMAHLPYLFTVHNLLPKMNLVQSVIFRSLAKKAARIIAVSEAVALTLEQNGVQREQIAVIPNGVDLSQEPTASERIRAELGIPTTARVVLGLGRLSPEKGFDVLIKAFSSLQPRLHEVYLIIAGDGQEATALKQQAATLGDRVRFPGYTAQTAPLFAVADLVVVPSRQEGQGIVPLEAMAAGRTVIASRVGGLVETVQEGRTGLLFPVEDAQALSAAMETLLNDPDRCAAMGRAGRTRVEQEYSLQKQIERTEAIYHDVFRRTA